MAGLEDKAEQQMQGAAGALVVHSSAAEIVDTVLKRTQQKVSHHNLLDVNGPFNALQEVRDECALLSHSLATTAEEKEKFKKHQDVLIHRDTAILLDLATKLLELPSKAVGM